MRLRKEPPSGYSPAKRERRQNRRQRQHESQLCRAPDYNLRRHAPNRLFLSHMFVPLFATAYVQAIRFIPALVFL